MARPPKDPLVVVIGATGTGKSKVNILVPASTLYINRYR
jgi:tRNA A37 N6-isopentenylltransferase MiaA